MADLAPFLPYLMIALLVILGLFVLFGIFWGLGRGFKRSLIRLATVVGFMLLAFFLTPLTANWIFGWNINIAGHTPAGWVDQLVQQLQDSNTIDYLAPVMPYLGEFIVGLALAIVNIVLFLAIYLLVKPISWIVYAIIAKFAAPKKDRDGNKKKKYALAGGLVGLVQGLVLFFFFMLPFNGLLGIVNQAANYQPANYEPAAQTQSLDDETSSSSNADYDVMAVAQQLDGATKVYTNILRYTGLEFLSQQAFSYTTMVRLPDGTKVAIRDDLVTGLELVSDVMAFQATLERVNDVVEATDDIWLAMAEVTPADYDAARNLVNKFFSLNILKLGDVIMADLDKIMAETWDEDVMLPNSHIYRDSAYGVLTEMLADENHRDEFKVGLQAMVKYLADQKLYLVKSDLLQTINLLEKVYTLQIDTDAGKQPVIVAITRPDLAGDVTLNRLLTTVGENDLGVDANATVIDVLFDSYLSLGSVHMLAATGAENFILYSNYFDNLDDEGVDGLADFVRTFTSGFFGDQALVQNVDPKLAGHWYKLKEVAKSVLSIVRDHYYLTDEVDEIIAELRDDQPDAGEDALYLQAIVRYVAGLSDEAIDNLAVGLHQAVFMFNEVTNFLQQQIPNLPLGEFNDIFTTLLATDDLAAWQSTLKGLKSTMVMLDKASAVIQDITEIINNSENVVQDVLTAIVGDGTDGSGLNPDEVADIVYEVLQIESVGDKLDEVLQNIDLGDFADDAQVQAAVEDLKDYLNQFDATDKTEAEIAAQKAELQQIFTDIWDNLRNVINQDATDTNEEGLAA